MGENRSGVLNIIVEAIENRKSPVSSSILSKLVPGKFEDFKFNSRKRFTTCGAKSERNQRAEEDDRRVVTDLVPGLIILSNVD